MMGTPDIKRTSPGYCLAELIVAVSLLGLSAAIGLGHFAGIAQTERARASAQSMQAAIAWTQTGVLWLGVGREVSYDSGGLSVQSETDGHETALGSLVPITPVTSNVSRWNTNDGLTLAFRCPWATPDSGGSIYFGCGDRVYKVTVRPESGLTVRAWVTR